MRVVIRDCRLDRRIFGELQLVGVFGLPLVGIGLAAVAVRVVRRARVGVATVIGVIEVAVRMENAANLRLLLAHVLVVHHVLSPFDLGLLLLFLFAVVAVGSV